MKIEIADGCMKLGRIGWIQYLCTDEKVNFFWSQWPVLFVKCYHHVNMRETLFLKLNCVNIRNYCS